MAELNRTLCSHPEDSNVPSFKNIISTIKRCLFFNCDVETDVFFGDSEFNLEPYLTRDDPLFY